MFNRNPVLTASSRGYEVASRDDSRYRYRFVERFTSILIAEQRNLQIGILSLNGAIFRLSIRLASALHSLEELIANRNLSYKDDWSNSSEATTFRECIRRVKELSEETPESRDVHHLAEACHASLVFLYNLVVDRLPQGHPTTLTHSDGLVAAVRKLQPRIWERVPYLRIWM